MSEPIYFARINQNEFDLYREISMDKGSLPIDYESWHAKRLKMEDVMLVGGLPIQFVPIRFEDFVAYLRNRQIREPTLSFIDEFARAKAIASNEPAGQSLRDIGGGLDNR